VKDGPPWSVNPFIAVLRLTAAVLVVGGTWVVSTVASNPGPIGGTISFLMMTFAPNAVLAGLFVVLYLLFWHAVQRQQGQHSDCFGDQDEAAWMIFWSPSFTALTTAS
jgi:hypothetical protein